MKQAILSILTLLRRNLSLLELTINMGTDLAVSILLISIQIIAGMSATLMHMFQTKDLYMAQDICRLTMGLDLPRQARIAS